jgi:hypothetical protein
MMESSSRNEQLVELLAPKDFLRNWRVLVFGARTLTARALGINANAGVKVA